MKYLAHRPGPLIQSKHKEKTADHRIHSLCFTFFNICAGAIACRPAPARRAGQGTGGKYLLKLSQRRHHYSGRRLQHGAAMA